MLQFVCYLLRFHLASDWSRNNKHSRNYLWCSQFCGKDCNYNIWIVEINSEIKYRYLVVDAWAIMFPPIGFLGSAWNMEAPSTWATTWFVMITATPNWIKRGQITIYFTIPSNAWKMCQCQCDTCNWLYFANGTSSSQRKTLFSGIYYKIMYVIL